MGLDLRFFLLLFWRKMCLPLREEVQRKAASKAADYMATENITGGIVLGGSNALTDYTVRYIFDMSEEDRIIER